MEFTKEKNRIYMKDENGKFLAKVTFPEVSPGVVEINHTFVDDSLRGQGVAAQLMESCYEMLKDDGRKAIPSCSYAVKWYEQHPEKNDIVAKDQ